MERGKRSARHIFSNLRLLNLATDRRAGTLILTLYAADGEPPYGTLPLMVADYDDVYVRRHGVWLYESRKITPVFGLVPVLSKPTSS
jgi:hypothetical protein